METLIEYLGIFTFYTNRGKYSIYCELEQARYLTNNEIVFNGDGIYHGIWETFTNRIYL